MLTPLDDGKSPIDGYLKKIGSTPYHICYEVRNIYEAMLELQEIGFTVLGSLAESIPLEGMVCFLYSQEIGLIELIDYSNN